MPRLITFARLLALAIVTLACAATLRTASARVDGTRYFWLDDDQMISMRYARNLAEGQGLVWNPGERVEGYTNPGWTLVMAGLHLLPIPAAKMAVAVKVVSWLLACWILLLAARLTRHLAPRDDLAVAFVLVTLACCRDLVFWAANGFDTTLLTATFLFVLVRLLDERDRGPRALTYLAMGLLPIIRSDAYYVWAGAAAVAWGLARDRGRVTRWLAVSLCLPIAHVAIRREYYGAWLPNTFYVKVSGVGGRLASAIGYLKGYVAEYAVVLPLAAAALLARRGWRVLWLGAPLAFGGAYVLVVGADMYAGARFLAYTVPLVLALAGAGTVALVRDSRGAKATVLTALAAGTIFAAGINGPSQFWHLASGNGMPEQSLVAALTIDHNTSPDATIAVVAAGIAPYFSHRRAFDLMGLTDARIARSPAHADAPIGHAKYDVEYTLSRRPDVLLSLWDVTDVADSSYTSGRSAAIRTDPAFLRDYAQHALKIDSPDGSIWIFIRGGSAAAPDPSRWRPVTVER